MKLGTFIQRCITVGRDTGMANRFAVNDSDLSTELCAGAVVLHGDVDQELGQTVLVGVDLGMGEILIADRLRERGEDVGFVLGHRSSCCRSNPRGSFHSIHNRFRGTRNFDPLDDLRQPFTVDLPEKDIDAARLLDIPYTCVDRGVHSLLTDWLQQHLDEEAPLTLGDLLNQIKEVAEFQHSTGRGEPVQIICGDESEAAGTVCVDTADGSRGNNRRFAALKQAGVKTIVVMNACAEQRAEATRLELNLVEMDYLAADSLGLNLLIDHAYQGETAPLVLECSGFRRVNRKVAVATEDEPRIRQRY